MTVEEELAWWKVVFLHEAGHCIASIVRYGIYHPITAQNDPDDAPSPRKASHQHKPAIGDVLARPEDYLILLCGGAAAEWRVLGQDSEGFAGDKAKLYKIPPLVPEAARQEMKRLADEEIASKFAKTIGVLGPHRKALDAVSDAALAEFQKMGLIGKEFGQTVILSAEDVQRLYEANLVKPVKEQAPAGPEGPPSQNSG